jgi:hypothetical protein
MLQDIGKWNGEMGLELGNEDASLEMPGPEPEWLSGICIAYYSTCGKPPHAVIG